MHTRIVSLYMVLVLATDSACGLSVLCRPPKQIGRPSRNLGRIFATSTLKTDTFMKSMDLLRVTKDGTPRLASAYGQLLGLSLRVFAGGVAAEGLRVGCEATSNRDLLAGKVDRLSVKFDSMKGPWLTLSRGFEVEGENLHLGSRPALLLLGPLLLPLVARLVLQSGKGVLGLLTTCFAVILAWVAILNAPIQTTTTSARGNRRKSSMLIYRLTVASTDIAASFILRRPLRMIVAKLLRSSLVGQALSASAAATTVAAAAEKGQRPMTTDSATKFLLGGGGSGAKNTGGGFESLPQRLAEATKFRVLNVGVDDSADSGVNSESGGSAEVARLVIDAEALFPDEDASRLAFTLRCECKPGSAQNVAAGDVATATATGLAMPALSSASFPTDGTSSSSSSLLSLPMPSRQQQRHALVFSNPAVRAEFAGLSLFGWKPTLWVPVLAGGFALPLGRRHRLTEVKAVTTSGGTAKKSDPTAGSGQGHLVFSGELYLNGDA